MRAEQDTFALQMLLKLGTKLVPGSSGGEDLFLTVEAFASGGFKGDVENALLSLYKGEADPSLFKAFEEAWEVALTIVPLVENDSAEEEVGSDLFVRDGHLRSGAGSDYGFSIDWDLEKAKQKVWASLKSEWVYSLKSKQFCLATKIFVDGNAD